MYLKLLYAESTGIPTLFWNNRVCASDCAKAEALRQQYESVFTCEDLCSTPSLGPSPYPDIPELFVSELGIMKLLQNIDTSKAAGPDLLPARILKEAAAISTLPSLEVMCTVLQFNLDFFEPGLNYNYTKHTGATWELDF